MQIFKLYNILITLAILFVCQGCDSLDNDRIPNMPVNISLSDIGMWNAYGVSGFGSYRIFTISPRQPSNFPYTGKNYTGFGGVLLIEGLDPFAGSTSVPMAYDIACPVERKAEIKIHIEPDTYKAVCNQCGSVFDVTMQRGAPVDGPAASGEYKCGLKIYNCISTASGGYVISN